MVANIGAGYQRELFSFRPDLSVFRTRVVARECRGKTGFRLAVADHIHQPGADGYPSDKGYVEVDGGERWEIASVLRDDDGLWLTFDSVPDVRDVLVVHVDRPFRSQLSRLHTLSHIVSASALRVLGDVSVSSAIEESIATIRISTRRRIEDHALSLLADTVYRIVTAGHTVSYGVVPSVEAGQATFGRLFRAPPLEQQGPKPFRIVVIDTVDAALCSGVHYGSTRVGPYVMAASRDDSCNGEGVELSLELAANWSSRLASPFNKGARSNSH